MTISTTPVELARAYEQTRYEVYAGENTLMVKVGEIPCESILSTYPFCFITASNPRSEKLSVRENARRNGQLRSWLITHAMKFLPAAAIPSGSDWEPEAGFCVLGISRQDSVDLGRAFEQNAIVYGLPLNRPELIWIMAS